MHTAQQGTLRSTQLLHSRQAPGTPGTVAGFTSSGFSTKTVGFRGNGSEYPPQPKTVSLKLPAAVRQQYKQQPVDP